LGQQWDRREHKKREHEQNAFHLILLSFALAPNLPASAVAKYDGLRASKSRSFIAVRGRVYGLYIWLPNDTTYCAPVSFFFPRWFERLPGLEAQSVPLS
jgi:hypothetical protein